MTREQLIAKIRRFARRACSDFTVNKKAGKGSHYRVRLDGRQTTFKDGRYSPAYVKLVLKQLGLTPQDLD